MKAQQPVITFLGMTMSQQTRWNFLCEAANAAMVGCFIGVVGPFGLPLAIRMGASSLEVALISSGPFIANLLSPLWVHLMRNSRSLPWVVGPHILWRGLLGFIGMLKSPTAITGVITTANLAVAAANPAYGTLVQKVFPAPIRGRLMGYVRLTLAMVMLPVTLGTGLLIDRFDPRWLFLAAGFMGLCGIGVYALTREPYDAGARRAPPRPGVIEGIRLAWSDLQFRRFLIAAVVFHGGVLVANPLYSVFQVREMGLSNAEIGYLAVAWNAAWLGAFPFWGRMVDRRGPRFVVTGAAMFYLGLPLAYGLGGGLYGAAIVGALCQGVADAAMDLGGWNMILSANPDRVGPYTSAAMMVTGVRGALGPLLGSWLLSAAGFQVTFLTAATLVTIGLLIFLSGNRPVGQTL